MAAAKINALGFDQCRLTAGMGRRCDKAGTRHLEYYTIPVWVDKSNASGGNCFPVPKS